MTFKDSTDVGELTVVSVMGVNSCFCYGCNMISHRDSECCYALSGLGTIADHKVDNLNVYQQRNWFHVFQQMLSNCYVIQYSCSYRTEILLGLDLIGNQEENDCSDSDNTLFNTCTSTHSGV